VIPGYRPKPGISAGRPTVTVAVTLAAMGLFAIRTLQGWICRVGAPVVWDYGPAQLAVYLAMVVRGGALYRDFRLPPFIPLVYGPVIPWLIARIAPLVGTGPMAALEAGRAATILSTLAVTAAIFKLARRGGAGAAAAAIAALAFVLSPLVQRWGFEFRVDLPALACELWGIWAFGAGLSAPAVALFVAGFFIKQGQAAGIAAAVLFCWMSGERRRAIALGAAWLAIVVAAAAILAEIYPWYWLNTFTAIRVAKLDPSALALFFAVAVGADAGLVILAGRAMLRRRAIDRLGLCFLGAALLQDSASCLRWGSNAYYFLPTIAALAIVAASELDWAIQRAEAFGALKQAAAGLAIGLVLSAGFLLAGDARAVDLGAIFRPALRCETRQYSRWDPRGLSLLHSIDATVLTDEAELSLVDTRDNVQWIDLMILGAMKTMGTFDDTALVASIRAREIGAFALDREMLDRKFRGRALFWPALRSAIEENYQLAPNLGPPWLMMPKSRISR